MSTWQRFVLRVMAAGLAWGSISLARLDTPWGDALAVLLLCTAIDFIAGIADEWRTMRSGQRSPDGGEK